MIRAIVILLALSWSAMAGATPNPWAFDFDPNIAQEPAYVNARLDELKVGLPGLPEDAGIVEATSGQVKLYFFDDVLGMLNRARDSGPGIMPPVARPPAICVEHESFEAPELNTSSNFLCELSEGAIMAVFEKRRVNTCRYVEYPESYVYDRSPLNEVNPNIVGNWSLLISLIGEALTYIDYPEGLFPADFMERVRSILAKLRYQDLKAQIAAQIQGYKDVIAKAQTDIACYDATAVNAMVARLTLMIAELEAAERHLDGIYQAGLTQAAADRKAIENQGRIRNDLPYPALTDRDRELLAMYVAGICWRIRGSGLVNLPDDETGSGLWRRTLYVQYPFHLIAELAGGVADAPGVGFQIFFDETWGYAEWFDMGTVPGGRDKYADLVEMTKRGKRATNLVRPTLENLGYDIRPLVAGGLQMGLCYYYVWEELNDLNNGQLTGFLLGEDLDDKSLYPTHVMRFLEWPTATGEVCTGAALALGLVRSFLRGKPGGTVCTPDCTNKSCGADDGCGTPCTAGCPPSEAGPPALDASVPLDSGVPVTSEAGMQIDSGHKDPPPSPSGGCSYRGGSGDQGAAGGMLTMLFLAFFALGRCRRRRR